METEFHHIPVLLNDVLNALDPHPKDAYLDVTLGGAGHASAIARRLSPGGSIVGIDRDPTALGVATARLHALSDELSSPDAQAYSLSTYLTSFIDFDAVLRKNGVRDRENGGGFDCVLADFGLSSHQIDDASRGFSFQSDAPLDMRMSQSGPTAADFLRAVLPDSLADILYENGDIRQSRRLARKICERAAAGEQMADARANGLVLADVLPQIQGVDRRTRSRQVRQHARRRIRRAVVHEQEGHSRNLLDRLAERRRIQPPRFVLAGNDERNGLHRAPSPTDSGPW